MRCGTEETTVIVPFCLLAEKRDVCFIWAAESISIQILPQYKPFFDVSQAKFCLGQQRSEF